MLYLLAMHTARRFLAAITIIKQHIQRTLLISIIRCYSHTAQVDKRGQKCIQRINKISTAEHSITMSWKGR